MNTLSGLVSAKMLSLRLPSTARLLISSQYCRSFSRNSASRPERTNRPERPSRPYQSSTGERLNRTDRPERSSRPYQSNTGERSNRTDRPERSSRPYLSNIEEKPNRTDRPERSSRPYRSNDGQAATRTPPRSSQPSPRYNRASRPDEAASTGRVLEFSEPTDAPPAPSFTSFTEKFASAYSPVLKLSRREKDLLTIQSETGLVSQKEKGILSAKETKRAMFAERMREELGDSWETIVAARQAPTRQSARGEPVKKKNRWTQAQKDEHKLRKAEKRVLLEARREEKRRKEAKQRNAQA